VIVLEMTGSHGNVIPLMTAAMLGCGTARRAEGQEGRRGGAEGA
jgi:H+/Cl- antiporter ClcA